MSTSGSGQRKLSSQSNSLGRPPQTHVTRTVLATLLALLAFAGNSLLCRMALRDPYNDPISFTALRLLSGAVVLAPLLFKSPPKRGPQQGWNLKASLSLAAYAITFSFAYITLSAGTGALLLFGFVQLTMLTVGWLRGERPSKLQSLGALLAAAGVLWLVAPGVSAPDPWGALLMATAGVGWGLYSLLGRGVQQPSIATAKNFALVAPMAALAIAWQTLMNLGLDLNNQGLVLAITSGAITSGLGYIIWYSALRGHTRSSAAIVQLAVPILAALGGVLFLQEPATLRLTISAALTLGGIALYVSYPAHSNLSP